MEIIDKVKIAVNAADNKKGEDIEVIRIGDLTVIADYFVFVTGTSSTHVRALSEEIEYQMSQNGIEAGHIEGKTTGWICLDYSSVVIHVFSRDQRDYFQLERLWSDGEKIDVSSLLED